MIPVVRAFFLLSVIAFLGTHARTLPEDIFEINNTYHGRTSNFGRPSGPSEHPSPQVDPPHHNGISISGNTGNSPNMITRPTQAPPPYQEWTLIFANHEKTPPSHPSPHVAPGHEQGFLTSISYITNKIQHEETITRPKSLSPPPTPRLAPPYVQTS